MGYAIETVVGSYSTAASTGTQAYNAASGQSFNIRAFQPNTTATLEAIWGYSALATLSRIRSPRLHDDVVGIESQQFALNASCTAVSILGTDIGNLQVGGPGSVDPKITRYWFVEQEFANSKPSIPVINSQNKGSTLVQVFTPAASTAVRVTLLFAYLGPIS